MLSQQEMSDRFEIQDLLNAYCHAIDRRDWDALDDMFTEDAVIDYSDVGGARGTLPEIKPWLDKALKKFTGFQHMIATTELKLDGDKAMARSVLFNPMIVEQDGARHVFFAGLWYCDELVRTDAGWRIKHRREELSYFHNLPEDFQAEET